MMPHFCLHPLIIEGLARLAEAQSFALTVHGTQSTVFAAHSGTKAAIVLRVWGSVQVVHVQYLMVAMMSIRPLTMQAAKGPQTQS